MSSLHRTVAASALLFALACAVGPDYQTPKTEVATAWREETTSALVAGEPELTEWWRHFDDPMLDELIERAARQGLDLREAFARVREARALRGVSASDYYPTVDAVASYEHRDQSKNTAFGNFAFDKDLYSVGFDAAWELDLWGRVRRSVEAADADLEASYEDAHDVAVTVAAETALSYVDYRAFQARVAIARNNVALQEQTLEVVNARFESGLVDERDVAQARTNVEATRSRVPALEIGLRAAENRLAVLLGLAPGSLAEQLGEAKPIPVPPIEIAVGVPADLLRRRADVRRAERVLAAETARIGVAEGDLYPRIALIGNLGLTSNSASTLFESDSKTFGFGPSLRWNLFDGGRLRGLVKAQDARAEQALVHWERAVLVALEESENAMTSFVHEQTRRTSLVAAADQARRAVELAKTQYGEGLTDFQIVLISERALADLEDELALSEAAITGSAVRLYKALGGGSEHVVELARAR